MESLRREILRLEKQWNLTSSDEPVQDILTDEEKAAVVHHAISESQKHMVWRMVNAGANEFQIESRLKHTDWSRAIDKEGLFAKANREKHYQLWLKEKHAREELEKEKRRQEIVKQCDANYFYRLMRSQCSAIGKKFLFNDQTKPLITALCYFFSRDPRFETELGYDFKKGLLIRGACGLGKTFLIDLIKDNPLKRIHVVSMHTIEKQVMREGEYIPPAGGYLYLDDVGVEEQEVFFYRTGINWFSDYIETTYLNNRHGDFSNLLISTNNTFDKLEDRYGYRVRSRFKEMVNVIDVNGKDLRT